jgi:HK97 family phage portal protein
MAFSIFDIFKTNKVKPKSSAPNILSGTTLSNLTTISTQEGVMSISAAFRCVNVIAETIAQLNGDIYFKSGNFKEVKPDHPLYYLLFHRPSVNVSSFVFRRQLVYNYLMLGNGYAVIKRDNDMNIVALELVKEMDIFMSEDKQVKIYVDKKTQNKYDSSEVIHLADIGYDEIKGESRITKHKETFGKSKASSKLANKLYSNGLYIGGTIQYPENIQLTETEADELSSRIEEKYGSVDNAGRVLVLDSGGKFDQHTNMMSLSDAEYILGEHLTIEDICRIFGVPPFKVFHFNKMTYDNMEAMKVDFVESCILPIVVQLEQELNYKLFSLKEIKKGYSIKHDIKSILRADVRAQADYLKSTFSIGKYTINEMRAMDDQMPVEGGDTPFIQVNNYMPLGMVEEYAQAMIDSKKSNMYIKNNEEEE